MLCGHHVAVNPFLCGPSFRLIGDSKLAAPVNVSMNGCLRFCVSLVMYWQPVRCARCLSLYDN